MSIRLFDVGYRIGERVLFNGANLSISTTDKIGLLGRNGAGKSTLLKIISRELKDHEGKIDYQEGTVGYLEQTLHANPDQIVIYECMDAFFSLYQLKLDIQNHENLLISGHSDPIQISQNLYNLQEKWLNLEGDKIEAEASKILLGLGFKQTDLFRAVKEFSGGWQMRIELAKILLKNPDFLLLDEPTNHLDIDAIIWLEKYLANYPGGLVLISHDRVFIKKIVNRIWDIEHQRITDYKLPYDRYLIEKAEREKRLIAAYENQQRVIADKERTIERFRAKASKARMAQSMEKMLQKVERIELEEDNYQEMRLRFDPAPRTGKVVLTLENLSKAYGHHQVIDQAKQQILQGDRIAIVGQNGQGKSTLVKLLIGEIEATDGHVEFGHNVLPGYYAQDQAAHLNPKLTVLETIEHAAPPEKRTQLRHILGAFLFSSASVDKQVSVLSGGERARLALACLITRPVNLLVLDEPTNHLDVESKEVLKNALLTFEGCLLVVSHDRDFLEAMTNKTWEIKDGKIIEYLGDINYFLEKKEAVDIRQFTQSDIKTNQHSKEAPSHEERKKILRQIQNLERKIEQLEEEISQREKVMNGPDFFKQPTAASYIQAYEKLKTEVGGLVDQWEQASQLITS